MHGQNFFIQALIYLGAAVISVPIAKRLGLGSVLGYLLAGIIIGPYAFSLIGEEGADIMHFAEFGVVMMLFLIGLELKPSLLWEMRKSIFGLGGLQLIVTSILIGGIVLIFSLRFTQALTIGMILSLSSTAIVLQTLAEKKWLKSEAGQSAFSVLLFQDIAVIPILAILPLFAGHSMEQINSDPGTAARSIEQASPVSSIPGWQQFILIVVVVVGIIFIGKFIARHIFRIIAGTGLREIFTAAALLLVISIAIAMEKAGLSAALGTFLAGVVLADNEYRHELESDIEPFKGLLLGLFFIAVGASIDFRLLIDRPMYILGLLGLLISVKFLVLYILAKIFKLRSGQEMLFSFSLAQGGEFAFVLISFSRQNSILNDQVLGLLLIIVALSMAFTPLLLIIFEKLVLPRFSGAENREPDIVDEKDNPVIIAGFGRFGVVVGRFLLANGINTTILDNNPRNIQVLRKLGFKVYYGDATRPDLLHSAGAANARILILAIADKESSIRLSEYVKKTYPNLKIIARARDNQHAFEFFRNEIMDIQKESFESAVNMGIKVLQELGIGNYQAYRASLIFRHHDEEIMQDLYQHWLTDKKQMIKEAKRHSEQLESIFAAEKEQSIHESDIAWDSTTLREEIRELYGAGGLNTQKSE